jgi:signal transduction histidine kinase
VVGEDVGVVIKEGGGGVVRRWGGWVLGVPVDGGGWRQLAYGVVCVGPGLVVGLAGSYLLALALVLSVTQVGLPLLAALLVGARWLGGVHRRLLGSLLGRSIPPPAPPADRPRGLRGFVRTAVRDGDAWRAVGFIMLNVPLSLLVFAVTVAVRGYALLAVSYPLWWQSVGDSGHDRRAAGLGLDLGPVRLDTWPRALLTAVAGLALLALAGWAGRHLLNLVAMLGRALLGPSRLADRVHDLEETRALAVQDSAVTLRRIERDLHDGAQARLIAVAMALAGAKSRLAAADADAGRISPEELHRSRELVEQALANSKTAIEELRDLVRGIHPPVLDDGLDAALESLAARSAVPVRSRVEIPVRPPEAIETIAYFCAAELLANAARYSGAPEIELTAELRRGTPREGEPAGGVLRLTVRDTGRGGAAITPGPHAARGAGGSGLAGLSERVRTVDGTLSIDSPVGGPTVIVAELPADARPLAGRSAGRASGLGPSRATSRATGRGTR